MSRDSGERRKETRDQRGKTGATEERSSRSTVPARSGDEGEGDTLQELRIVVVDELMDVGRRQDTVRQQVQPDETIQQHDSSLVSLDDGPFAVSRVEQRVEDVVRPRRQLTQSGKDIRLQTVRDVSAVSVTHQVQSSVDPSRRVKALENIEVSTVSEISINRRDNWVTHEQRPSHDSQLEQAMMHERVSRQAQDMIVEDDPVFDWVGGSPYGSGRPKLVLHRSRNGVETLPFLQVLLRDTYKELEGGEPSAEMVEFVANEPRVPLVQKNIVTLDLTEPGWSSSIRNGEPVIKRNNLDIVPKLQEVAETLYTGELGYFVVNVPDEWEGAVLQQKFFSKLVERLTDGSPEENGDSGVFDLMRSAPVVVAEPQVNSEEQLIERMGQYFSLQDIDADEELTIGQVEAVAERFLRRNDWKRIALTERQRHVDESDEHFLWKAAIAEGLAWELYQWHKQEVAEDDDIGFRRFVQSGVLAQDRILTEKVIEGAEDGRQDVVADLSVRLREEWVSEAVDAFISGTPVEAGPDDVVVEFETGRGEGAFNFRKLRESLEKYRDASVSSVQVCVVVPSRLFFRGEHRARMILALVETWNEQPDTDGLDADVFVPVLSEGYCRRLQRAETFVQELYGGDETDE